MNLITTTALTMPTNALFRPSSHAVVPSAVWIRQSAAC